jgi:hypothetical protein
MNPIKCLIFLIVFSVSSNVLAQDKLEKESSIKPKEVPSKALLFIDSLNFITKVKWFEEEGLDKKSIEAKFKLNKVRYSIEFDSLGVIEDVEIEVNWESLESNWRDSISSQLKLDCSSHKIEKIQRQLTGSEKDLLYQLKTDGNFEHLKTKYEIIVKCSKQKKVELFEYLFTDKGILVSTSKIIFKNSSHLEY